MKPLVSCEELQVHMGRPDVNLLILDCRFDLADPDKGIREYAKAHIPGARFAHVERDLSGPAGDGHKGRHPMPMVGSFQRFLGQNGLTPATLVVAYDDAGGQWASRAWWLLRHFGHAKVAVLDGGLTRWKALKLPMALKHEPPAKTTQIKLVPGSMPTVSVDDLAQGKVALLIDSRAGERYRGEVEPVDKRAGHIPGAVTLPFAQNVGPDQRFLPADQIKARIDALPRPEGAGIVACYCGSGVTSTHNVLAMELAGLPTPALYPGSWSEWSYPAAGRPIKTGPEP